MEEKDKVIQVSVEDILPNRFQPRLAFDEKELTELSNSILKYGVIQPIVLRKIGNKYEIIAGERRYKATVMAGLKTIPAIINNTDDNTSAEIALLENLQRKNLTVIEEAQSFKKLLDRNFTQEEIANKLGVSQSSIANKLRLLNLPKQVQDALLFSKISERHARSLLSLNSTDLQLEMLDKIITERMTVKQTEDEIKKILNEDNDIPDNINKYIEAEKEDIEEKPQFIQYVPDVVNIEEKNINPFQLKFKENIDKIEENINILKWLGVVYFIFIIFSTFYPTNYLSQLSANSFSVTGARFALKIARRDALEWFIGRVKLVLLPCFFIWLYTLRHDTLKFISALLLQSLCEMLQNQEITGRSGYLQIVFFILIYLAVIKKMPIFARIKQR